MIGSLPSNPMVGFNFIELEEKAQADREINRKEKPPISRIVQRD
jgi:hypothetical protein